MQARSAGDGALSMGLFGPLAATTQFYLYGRRHCTANGWRRASANYDLGMLDTVDLSTKVYIVTGANSGIGRCLSDYLASRGASLYMVCRNEARAEVAMREIRASSGNDRVHTLIGDCSLATDVRRVMQEFGSREQRLDGLVCNAGAITPTKTVTSEGYEVTLATHLLHGSYLLATLAMPHLRRCEAGPRVLFVSSGGMYNTPWPGWATANDAPASEYNQELAYAHAKRGQVLRVRACSKDMPLLRGRVRARVRFRARVRALSHFAHSHIATPLVLSAAHLACPPRSSCGATAATMLLPGRRPHCDLVITPPRCCWRRRGRATHSSRASRSRAATQARQSLSNPNPSPSPQP